MTEIEGAQELEKQQQLDSLLTQVQCVFQVMEPWATATCRQPKGEAALQLVKIEVDRFSAALTQSAKAAQLCYNCADKGEMIMEGLLDPKAKTEELRSVTEGTVKHAAEANVALCGVVKALRDNRVGAREGLEAATKDINSELAEQKGKAERAIRRIQNYRNRARDVQMTDSTPLLVVLPVILPFLEFASDGLVAYEGKKVERRNSRTLIYEEVANDMQRALDALTSLESSLDSLTAWWIKVEMAFGSIRSKLDDLREGGQTIYIRSLIQSFSKIKSEFSRYKSGIIKIQDHYSGHNRQHQ